MPLKVVPLSNELPGFAPLPTELVTGELALNTSDGVLYTKLADGTIASVCCGGSSAPAAATPSNVPEHYDGGVCGPCRNAGMGPATDAATTIDSVMCDFCILSIQWKAWPGRCSPVPDYYDFQYSVDGGSTWVTMSSLTQDSLGVGAAYGATTSMLRPSNANGLFLVRVVVVSVGGTHAGNCQTYAADGINCACDPPPPPPPTRFECIDGACGETSGTPDFVASWPTPGECAAHMTCETTKWMCADCSMCEEVPGTPDFVDSWPTHEECLQYGGCPPCNSWLCTGSTTCTYQPGIRAVGPDMFLTLEACTAACVIESWTCNGTTCTHTPGVAPNGITHFASSEACTTACHPASSYTCANGQCAPSPVAPDNVTFFETWIECDVLCAEPTGLTTGGAGCSHAFHTLFNGMSELDSPSRWVMSGQRNPGPCRHPYYFQGGWEADGVTPIYVLDPFPDYVNIAWPISIDSDGTAYTANPAGGFMRLPPYEAMGPCNNASQAIHVGGEGLPCTVYNPAP